MNPFKLILPCYFDTEESKKIESIKGDANAEYCEIRDITIYEKPYAISPYFEGDIEYGCTVYVGNTHFITIHKYSTVSKYLED